MGVSIQFDTSGMNSALDRFVRGVEEDTRKLLIADEARLLFRDAMKFTPSKTLAIGRRTVKSQIGRALFVIDPLKTKDKWLGRLINTGAGIGEINEYLSRTPGAGANAVSFFDANIHERARINGAISKKFRGKVPIIPNSGRGNNKAQWDQYVRKKQKNVGMFKSAFAGIIEALNNQGTARTNVPNWIARNKSKGSRLVDIARLKLSGKKPSIEWRGAIHPYLVQPLSRAIRVREQALVRKANNILKGRAAIIDGKFTITRNDRGLGRSSGVFSA